MAICERCGESVGRVRFAVVGDYNSASWCDDCMATSDDVWSACAGDRVAMAHAVRRSCGY